MSYTAVTVGASGWAGQRDQPLQGALVPLRNANAARFNWLRTPDFSGTIVNNNRVLYKADASSPEVPFAGALVRVHRLSVDGWCAWQGLSDVNGYYWPVGLEVGLAYYPVAIDLTGTHECDAAGPVIAVKAD